MATEILWSCPLCHNTRNDVAFTLPCRHQFCLGCILRRVKINPVCPLCGRTVETVRFSRQGEQGCIQFEITGPEEFTETTSRAGRAPFCLHESSLRLPTLLPLSPPQGTPSPYEQEGAGTEPVGGFLPQAWAALFRQQQHLLDPVQSWLHQRLVALYKEQWWKAEAVEASILHSLCAWGPHAEVLVEVLQPILRKHAAPLVHGIISAIVDHCSEEAQRLLDFCQVREQDNRTAASASSSSSQERTPTSSPPVFKVEEEAGTSQTGLQGSPDCAHPVPDPTEQEQPQEEGAGPGAQGSSCSPSASGRGRNHSPGGSQNPSKTRAPSPQDSP